MHPPTIILISIFSLFLMLGLVKNERTIEDGFHIAYQQYETTIPNRSLSENADSLNTNPADDREEWRAEQDL